MRKTGVRIVVLVGHAKPREIREKWLPLSVYDYILDPVTEEKISFAVEYPATLGMAEEKIALLENGGVEEEKEKKPSKWTAWLGKKQKSEKADSGKEVDDPPAWEPSSHTPAQQDHKEWAFTIEPQDQKAVITEQYNREPVKEDKQPKKESTATPFHKPEAQIEQEKSQQGPVFRFDASVFSESKQQPKGYNIIVTSPSAAGKTYVALIQAGDAHQTGEF